MSLLGNTIDREYLVYSEGELSARSSDILEPWQLVAGGVVSFLGGVLSLSLLVLWSRDMLSG